MKILYLSNNPIALDLYNWIVEQGDDTVLFQDKLTQAFIKSNKFDLVISYGYKFIIKPDVVEELKNKLINLHISYLPWNRGADPNFWSFVEDTPKGITIHLIDEGIDTGDIVYCKRINFNENEETLKSTYEKLNYEIQGLLKENWEQIRELNFKSKKQSGKGSLHYKKDFEKIKNILEPFGWDIPIVVLRNRYNKLLHNDYRQV